MNGLNTAKFSNKSQSIHVNDGLVLKNIYLTVALKCVPPFDKPTTKELTECFKYLNRELNLLKRLKIVVARGQIAFDSCLKLFDLKKSFFIAFLKISFILDKKFIWIKMNGVLFSC